MFEFSFKSDYIIEGSQSISRDILLASFSELEVTFFPEICFLLGLLELIMGRLQVLKEDSRLGDERMNDLLEGSRVLLVEIAGEELLF